MNIEIRIVQGLITSTEYNKNITPIWNPVLLESETAKLLCRWALEHFKEHGTCIGSYITDVFYKNLENDLIDKDLAEELEEDIFPYISEQEEIDVEILTTKTVQYLQKRSLLLHNKQVLSILEDEKLSEAKKLESVEKLKETYVPIEDVDDCDEADMKSDTIDEQFEKALNASSTPLFTVGGDIGEFLDSSLIEGGFVAFMAAEKRGKSYFLLELGLKAIRANKNVALFQAGDMSTDAQLRRIGVRLCRRSDNEKYCGEHYQAVPDCIRNQTNECTKWERENKCTPFPVDTQLRIKELQLKDLIKIYEDRGDYEACSYCSEYKYNNELAVPWIDYKKEEQPITANEIKYARNKYFSRYSGTMKISTHAMDTLTFDKIGNILDKWQRKGFVPDVVIIDYMDIIASTGNDTRTKENSKWKAARNLSQTARNGITPLVLTATQSDAASYKTHTLNLDNFSETKQKYAHVTAMYGLNQDPEGREKGLGLMRVNELAKREGDYHYTNQVYVIQNLKKGMAIINSMPFGGKIPVNKIKH